MAANPEVKALSQNIDSLINELAVYIRQQAPEHLRLFEVFSQEARFARNWMGPTLAQLKPGDSILEVGAGLMILSCQLAKEGYAVTGLEPIGAGFSSFVALQNIVLDHALRHGFKPAIMACPVEALAEDQQFDFAFSVNVMEHIDDVPQGLQAIFRALKPGASYRFTCPNYLFPYEPHFNMPTLFVKSLTARVFHDRIYKSVLAEEPAALWNSLNWINVLQVKTVCRHLDGARLEFNRAMLCESLERMIRDAEFAGRRPRWLQAIARGLVYFRLHRLTGWLPAAVLPIIDCLITKTTDSRIAPAPQST